eukprot:gene15148-biopygen12702
MTAGTCLTRAMRRGGLFDGGAGVGVRRWAEGLVLTPPPQASAHSNDALDSPELPLLWREQRQQSLKRII